MVWAHRPTIVEPHRGDALCRFVLLCVNAAGQIVSLCLSYSAYQLLLWVLCFSKTLTLSIYWVSKSSSWLKLPACNCARQSAVEKRVFCSMYRQWKINIWKEKKCNRRGSYWTILTSCLLWRLRWRCCWSWRLTDRGATSPMPGVGSILSLSR